MGLIGITRIKTAIQSHMESTDILLTIVWATIGLAGFAGLVNAIVLLRDKEY